MQDDHESPAIPRLLAARRRYLEMRAALCCDSELDVDLHAELSAAIRTIDTKIAQLFSDDAPA